MSKSDHTLKHENVNGVMLALNVDGRNSSPKLRQFTITYIGSRERDPLKPWLPLSVISLGVAILVNTFALIYIRINLTILVVIVTIIAFLIFFWLTHSVQSETLLVIPTVGVQSSVKYVVGREDNFVPWPNVDDIIINEALKLNRVLYVLTLIVKGNGASNQDFDSTTLLPVFKYTKPRLLMLESIYSEIKELLMDVKAGGAGDADTEKHKKGKIRHGHKK